jgi:hypothetical protein
MKKILVILIALIGLGMSASAQKQVTFYGDNEHITLYSDGKVGYWDGNTNWEGRWATTSGSGVGHNISMHLVARNSNGDIKKLNAQVRNFNIDEWRPINWNTEPGVSGSTKGILFIGNKRFSAR